MGLGRRRRKKLRVKILRRLKRGRIRKGEIRE
jgi:hypothetical protein